MKIHLNNRHTATATQSLPLSPSRNAITNHHVIFQWVAYMIIILADYIIAEIHPHKQWQ